MILKKDSKVVVHHDRKGTFNAILTEDFDTTSILPFPIILDQDYLHGMSSGWERGDKVPASNSIASIGLREEEQN